MYESALSQVFMLCSYGAVGYDGKAAGTSGVNGGSDQGSGRDLNIVRIRTYWCEFHCLHGLGGEADWQMHLCMRA
jgi:hypothetical protein